MPRDLDDGARVLGAEGGVGVPIHALPAHDGIPLALAHLVFAFKVELHGVGVRVGGLDFPLPVGREILEHERARDGGRIRAVIIAAIVGTSVPASETGFEIPEQALAAHPHSLEHHALPAGHGQDQIIGGGVGVEGVFGLHVAPRLERGVPRIGSEQAGGNQQETPFIHRG